MLRTHTCGELSLADLNKETTITGWITQKRELGPILFLVISDRYGMTQAVVEKKLISARPYGNYLFEIMKSVVSRSER